MVDNTTQKLVHAWVELWNGDLTQTPQAIADDFTSHAAPLMGGPAGTSTGRDLLNVWVTGIHQVLADLRFTIDVGPLREENLVCVRWRADSTYRGGYPGATAAPGAPVTFYGTDTLRVDSHGRIAEYWANADSLWFLQQLGVRDVPDLQKSA